MKTTFDTDNYLYSVLNASTTLVSALSGSIYNGERPANSVKEDVAVNTISLSQDYQPQIGTSNVNIHVPDIDVNIGGKPQKMKNSARLKQLTDIVTEVLREARILGLIYNITLQTTLQEAEINQHYVNLRIDWNIHLN